MPSSIGSSSAPKPPPTTSISTGSKKLIQSKEDLLAELRRQLDDSASDVGSTTASSSMGTQGRRRRRRNRNKSGGGSSKPAQALVQPALAKPPLLPRIAETKPVRLQLGLNLDAELELKARLQGDVAISLLIETNDPPAPRPSEELKPSWRGVVEKKELFHMRVGKLRFRQRWIDREVSPSLTVVVALGIAAVGFVAGFATARWVEGGWVMVWL